MNPFPMVLADLRALRWVARAIVLLIAIAVATGVAIGSQERIVRQGSAQAAEGFDLLVAAPGSQTQIVLTAVYLQLEALPLIDGALLNRLAGDSRVAGAAPIAFGDVVRGYPVIGTTASFVTKWGRLTPADGRVFTNQGEAVIGANVRLAIGDRITPAHGIGGRHRPGEDSDEEAQHRHAGAAYTIVGRQAPLGTPWDRAILVPVESVWETHGLGNGHERNDAPLGTPFDAEKVPGVPLIVLKPQSIASAYSLRAQYRQGGTMALFPAEVLVSLYQVMGDVRDVLLTASALNNLLILTATLLLLLALTGLRRRRYAILRALGAPPLYVFLVVWIGAAGMIAAGCVLGIALGWGVAWVLSGFLEHKTGIHLVFAPALSDLTLVVALIGFGSILASLPALLSYRLPIAEALRG